MGVMLALDKPRARLRRRGQHTRTPEEQACLDAFAAFLRCDAPSAGRSLNRVATTVLASRLLPAARALADAVDLVLAEQPLAAPLAHDAAVYEAAARDAPARDSPTWEGPTREGPVRDRPGRGTGPPGRGTVALNFTVSPACLLGVCRDGGCRSPLCEHACHSRPA
ncbi:MAG TPA: hypothetical protein VK586_25970 [Streptosporangiaceae bacterium]|nr:hypothetical protein [Streptosporangiaceae bacterium]